MLFFLPFSTDAPVRYWPYATVGLIIANVLAFFISLPVLSDPNTTTDTFWVLSHGQGLRPLEWVMSIFAHADFGHLFGNMVFLWVFGLVVEGKLGWSRFLACYLFIGVGESAIEQVLTLSYSGVDPSGSLGASTAIYGIMAMAIVWAPRNEINIFYFLWLVLFFSGTVGISIGLLAGFFICYDMFWVLLRFLLTDSAMSSSWLHVAGAAFGFPLAIVMYKRGIVDCEGWDMFHVLRGDAGAIAEREKMDAELAKKADQRRKQKASEQLDEARQQLDKFLEQRAWFAAYRLYDKMRQEGHAWELDARRLAALIKGLHAEGHWALSAPLMAQLLALKPPQAVGVRLKLAQICVVELDRPGRALDLLEEVDLDQLPPDQRRLAEKIAHRAEQLQSEGTVELDDGKW